MYLWLKVIHLLAIISWMAGLLYLPRLFVYHSKVSVGSETSEMFKVMERRLYRYIMTPAMIVAWVVGLILIFGYTGLQGQGWLHAKLLLVVAMSAAHGAMGRWLRDFAADRNRRSERFFRISNEVPTVLMIGIVVLAVVKPF